MRGVRLRLGAINLDDNYNGGMSPSNVMLPSWPSMNPTSFTSAATGQ